MSALLSIVATQVGCSSRALQNADAGPRIEAGYDLMRDGTSYVQFFGFSWWIERQDTFETLTCQQVGATTVQFTIDPASALSFPCDAQTGTSPVLPVGSYTVTAALVAADETVLSHTQPTPVPLAVGQLGDIPIVFLVAP